MLTAHSRCTRSQTHALKLLCAWYTCMCTHICKHTESASLQSGCHCCNSSLCRRAAERDTVWPQLCHAEFVMYSYLTSSGAVKNPNSYQGGFFSHSNCSAHSCGSDVSPMSIAVCGIWTVRCKAGPVTQSTCQDKRHVSTNSMSAC